MILISLDAPMLAIGEIHERHDDIAENRQRLVDGAGLLQLRASGLVASNSNLGKNIIRWSEHSNFRVIS
jgi:hypothetical protein